jgi:hypothetical protein
MSSDAEVNGFGALQAIISALQPLDADDRERILRAAALFLNIGGVQGGGSSMRISASESSETTRDASARPVPVGGHTFASASTLSPKEFLFEKQPQSDIERIAVLAYYLTHYRETPHFKTLDLSKLNTEAAQPKFSNAANAAGNAVKRGFLVPSTKGNRQLSAVGERFVSALPDRESARAAMAAVRTRKRSARKTVGTARPEAAQGPE